MSETKVTQDTKKYNSSGVLVETRNAGTKGFDAYPQEWGYTIERFYAKHSVGNPFCAAGSIAYEWSASVARTGGYSVAGYHRPVPHHEIYLRGEGEAWRTVYLKANTHFYCLIIYACTDARISKSG